MSLWEFPTGHHTTIMCCFEPFSSCGSIQLYRLFRTVHLEQPSPWVCLYLCLYEVWSLQRIAVNMPPKIGIQWMNAELFEEQPQCSISPLARHPFDRGCRTDRNIPKYEDLFLWQSSKNANCVSSCVFERRAHNALIFLSLKVTALQNPRVGSQDGFIFMSTCMFKCFYRTVSVRFLSASFCEPMVNCVSFSSSCLPSTLCPAAAFRGKTQRNIALPGRVLKYHLCRGVSMTLWQGGLPLSFLVHPQWCSCVLLTLSWVTHTSVSSSETKHRHPHYLAICLSAGGLLSVRQSQQCLCFTLVDLKFKRLGETSQKSDRQKLHAISWKPHQVELLERFCSNSRVEVLLFLCCWLQALVLFRDGGVKRLESLLQCVLVCPILTMLNEAAH